MFFFGFGVLSFLGLQVQVSGLSRFGFSGFRFSGVVGFPGFVSPGSGLSVDLALATFNVKCRCGGPQNSKS